MAGGAATWMRLLLASLVATYLLQVAAAGQVCAVPASSNCGNAAWSSQDRHLPAWSSPESRGVLASIHYSDICWPELPDTMEHVKSFVDPKTTAKIHVLGTNAKMLARSKDDNISVVELGI